MSSYNGWANLLITWSCIIFWRTLKGPDVFRMIPLLPPKATPCFHLISGIWRSSLSYSWEFPAVDRGSSRFSNYLGDGGTKACKALTQKPTAALRNTWRDLGMIPPSRSERRHIHQPFPHIQLCILFPGSPLQPSGWQMPPSPGLCLDISPLGKGPAHPKWLGAHFPAVAPLLETFYIHTHTKCFALWQHLSKGSSLSVYLVLKTFPIWLWVPWEQGVCLNHLGILSTLYRSWHILGAQSILVE